MAAYKRGNPGCCACGGGSLTCVCPGAPSPIHIVSHPGSGAPDYFQNTDVIFDGSNLGPHWTSSPDIRAASLDGFVVGGNAYGHYELNCGTSSGQPNNMTLFFRARSGTSGTYTVLRTLCTWTMTTSPNTCSPFLMASGVNGSGTPSGSSWTGSG